MKFSQLTVDLQDEIAKGCFGVAAKGLTAPQAIQLEDFTPIKLWEVIVVRLKPHAMHYAHVGIFTPDPREDRQELADAIVKLLTDRQYVVIDQNPWAGRKLSIEIPRPGKIMCKCDEEFLSIHDSYGIWCSLVPRSIDLWRGELSFYVTCRDHRDEDPANRFIRTFRLVNNCSSTAWEVLDRLFYSVYGRQS